MDDHFKYTYFKSPTLSFMLFISNVDKHGSRDLIKWVNRSSALLELNKTSFCVYSAFQKPIIMNASVVRLTLHAHAQSQLFRRRLNCASSRTSAYSQRLDSQLNRGHASRLMIRLPAVRFPSWTAIAVTRAIAGVSGQVTPTCRTTVMQCACAWIAGDNGPPRQAREQERKCRVLFQCRKCDDRRGSRRVEAQFEGACFFFYERKVKPGSWICRRSLETKREAQWGLLNFFFFKRPDPCAVRR